MRQDVFQKIKINIYSKLLVSYSSLHPYMPCCLPFYANWTESNISACMKGTRIDKYSTSRESKRKIILFWPFMKCRNFSETPKLQIGSYECGSPIGQGSFSKVIKAIHLESQRKVAIKIIDLRKISEKDGTASSGLASLKYLNLVKELQLQLQVRHENIVELIEVIQQDRYQFAVMPFAQNGNLLDWLEKKRGGQLGESEACFYFKQLISALAACHSVGVYHRDVKLENLLLMDEEALTLKLTDFGLGTSSYLNRHEYLNSCTRIFASSTMTSDASDKISSKLSTTDSLAHMDTLNFSEFSYEHFSCKTCCGTPLYASPEVLQGKSYSGGPADIWSAGVVLYMLVMGVAPFTSQSLEKLYDLIKKGLYTPTLGKVSRDLDDLFHRLFKIDPSERISIQELLYHPWLNRVHLYPWIPSPTFQIASLIKPFYLDPWKCFAEITAISYLKNGNCFRYKVQSTLELQHRSIKNESQKHHESSKKDSSGSVLGLVSADTASFEDIALHHIEDFNGGSTSKKASRSFSTEFVSKASGPLAYVGHFLSSWTFSLDQYPSTVHEATITGQSTSLHNLFRFGKKEKLKYSVLEGSSKLEALLKILNISFDTWVITRTKIIPRNTMGKKENSSFLPIENENDITAFLFKCQYETSLGEIYVFEVYLECASRLSYLLDSVPKFIVRPFTRSTNSSTFNSQSSFCPSDDSTASSIYPQTQVNALTTMQYKLFVPKDMPQTFLSKFEILLWKQFIMERMKT